MFTQARAKDVALEVFMTKDNGEPDDLWAREGDVLNLRFQP